MAKHSELSEQIEQVVRQYIASALHEAQGAVRRGFGDGSAMRTKSRSVATHAGAARRSEADVAALSEALYAAVCAQPGQTMAVLAPKLGESPKLLHRPMSRLRRARRVRTVGERHAMRYFPTTKQD